jgi:hypothetical protein
MVLLTAAAVAVSQPELPPRTAATAQARAIVRIVSAVRLRFDQTANEGAPPIRDTVIRTPDARIQPAKLIEFE